MDIAKDPNADKVALVDLDGTLAAYEDALYKGLRQLQSPKEQIYDVHNSNLPDWYKARIDLIRSTPGWWENLNKLPLGFELLEAAIDTGFIVHVLTKGPSRADNAWTEKLRWCRKNLPEKALVTVTEDKGLVYGRILIDDYPTYVMHWLKHRPRGLAVVPHHQSNAWFTPETARGLAKENKWDHMPNIVRYDGTNLAEVLDAMESAYIRDAKEPLSLASA